MRGLLRRQTLASFDYQWRELPGGGGLLSEEWFDDNVTRIITDELLCVGPEWFKGRRVLDAGCGNGRWSVGLLRLGCEVTAVDYSEHALGYVRENVRQLCSEDEVSRLQTKRVDLLDIPDELSEDRFDCVFSFGVLHHTGNTRSALQHVAALVRDDGLLFLYLYGRASVSRLDRFRLTVERLALAPLPFDVKRRAVRLIRPHADEHQSFDLLSPTINTRHTPAEVRAWLAPLGFEEIGQTIDHTELFIRALKDRDAVAGYLLPPPGRPYWFERYS